MKKSQTIKVAIRVRPQNARQLQLGSPTCIQANAGVVTITNNGEKKDFCYDYVFDSSSKQEAVYDATASGLVESVAEGYNGTIFAYGQTGAGKTWTMVGKPEVEELKGIIPRTFGHLFSITQSGDAQQYLLRASFIEIYNEEIRDLLVDKRKEKENKKELKESPDKGVFIKDLIMAPVKSSQDMEKILDFGNLNRTVHATEMNAVSSRSHAVFTLFFDTLTDVGGKQSVKAGKLNLVDLAGSERQNKTKAEGDRLKEGAKINLSLSALGNVINVLAEGKKGVHIPYRDSKLTRILQDSLGGNTKTIMIASISPALDNYDETIGTLRYASRAKTIKNAPKVNEDPKDALIKEYAEEIRRLKAELSGQQPMVELQPTDEKLKEIQEKLRKQFEGEKQEKEKLLVERNKLLKEKDDEKEELVRKLKEMEQNLLNRAEGAESQAALQVRKKKKKRALKAEEIASENIQRFVQENENILEEERTFKNVDEEVVYLRKLTARLRSKCKNYKAETKDLEKEFQVERQNFTDSLRDVESELSFFKNITKTLLTNDQILKIRDNSSYDGQKREYVVPPFMLKDSSVHFPKSLTSEQLQDLMNEKKQQRNVEFVKIDLKKPKDEVSSPSPNFRTKKYVYKVPADMEAYKQKNYQKEADSLLFEEDSQGFNRTALIFRKLDPVRSDSARRSSLSSGKKFIQPLKVVPKFPSLDKGSEDGSPKRPTSSRSKQLQPVRK